MRRWFAAVVLLWVIAGFVAAADDVDARWVSAITNDDAASLSALLEQAEGEALWTLTTSNGKTALMVACKVGDFTLVQRLVEQGADIGAQTVTQGTAFMFAVLGGQTGIVEWLEVRGADINARGSNGWSSVMIAAAKGHDETLAWLLRRGADANLPDVYGFTPLMRAADNQHVGAVDLLLQQDELDVHWQDERGNTALHYAVSSSNVEIVRRLLERGAEPLLSNASDLSALDLAESVVSLGKAAVLQLLQEFVEQ